MVDDPESGTGRLDLTFCECFFCCVWHSTRCPFISVRQVAADYVGLAGPSDKHIFAKSIGGADRPQWPQWLQCTSWGKMFLGSLKLDETGWNWYDSPCRAWLAASVIRYTRYSSSIASPSCSHPVAVTNRCQRQEVCSYLQIATITWRLCGACVVALHVLVKEREECRRFCWKQTKL